jgi:hypothetical protein
MVAMLVFIDESGHPHPKDAATRPVLAAVCISQQDCREISRTIFGIKRAILGPQRQRVELKARHLLTKGTFRRVPEKRELVEQFFAVLRDLPVTLFAVVMERPTREIPRDLPYLPTEYRYILQRAHLLLPPGERMAVVLVDGDGSQYGGLSAKFESFLHRSREGWSLQRVMDAPFFVDSSITAGIQIADMAAGAIRLWEESELFRGVPMGDAFLAAIDRYYRICREKTRDQTTPEGWMRYGFHRMPEAAHYPSLEEEVDEEAIGEGAGCGDETKPESQS